MVAEKAPPPKGLDIVPLEAWMLPACGDIARTAPDPWQETDFAPCLTLENRPCFVALQQGHPAGFACFLAVCETADLQLVAVAPALRGQGLGSALLRQAFARLHSRGVRRVLLEVRVSNQAALGLYQSLGFATLARRAGMYQNPPEDGFLLEKRLENSEAEGGCSAR